MSIWAWSPCTWIERQGRVAGRTSAGARSDHLLAHVALLSEPKSICEYCVALKAAEAKSARLGAEVGRLKEDVRSWRVSSRAAQRAANRQAAPFSRRKRKVTHRPAPDRVDEEVEAGFQTPLQPDYAPDSC